MTDLDTRFAATVLENTHRLIEAFRQAGVSFDVTVNGPKDDPNEPSYDIFWFRKENDMDFIGQIIRDTVPAKSR